MYTAQLEGQYGWVPVGGISVTQATLAVNGRDDATVEALAAANKVLWEPDDGTLAAEIRFRTDAADDAAWVAEIFAARGTDYYTRVGTLTMTVGKQVCTVGRFIDSIVITNDEWESITAETTADEIGRVRLYTQGYTKFLFIAPTLPAGKVLYVDVARKDQPWV